VLEGLDVRPLSDIRQVLELALTPAESGCAGGAERELPVAA
jgi:ATP-dependent Lon protease